MRDLLIVRTHVADPASLSAYDLYSGLGCFDVVFCCDERQSAVDCGSRNKVRFDNEYLTELGLYPHKDCGWRCGDYSYYVARVARPDYAFYWMVEPDVLINWSDIAKFFEVFRDNPSDFLAAKLRRRNWTWGWSAAVKDRYRDIYGCIFPLTRLSGRAIDQCFSGRRTASAQNKPINPVTWPNDEAFVACEICNSDLVYSDFNQGDRIFYSNMSFRNTVPHDRAKIIQSPPNDLLYHPVGDFQDWLTELESDLQNRYALPARATSQAKSPVITRSGATQLKGAAYALLESRDSMDAALVPLVLGRHAWTEGPWSGKTKSVDDESDARKAMQLSNKIRKRFGVKEQSPGVKGRRQLANVHVGTTKARLGKLAVSSADDFVLGASEPLGRFPSRFALPYAFDFDAKDLLCTMHMSPKAILNQPFLPAAQRQRAIVVARVPWSQLDRIYGAHDEGLAPIFVLSIGGMSFTLLDTAVRCLGGKVVSEPDTVTQLAAKKKLLRGLSSDARQRLLWHSVSAFLNSGGGVSAGAPCLIKLRSQASAVAEYIAETFPNAGYVFVLRNRCDWARSMYRTFRLSPEATARRLSQGLLALHHLSRSPVKLTVVRYEEMLADPNSVIKTLFQIPESLAAEVAEQITSVTADDLLRDPANSPGRRPQSDSDEEAHVRAFDEVWQRVRPGDIIDSLGIDIG